MIPVYIIFIVIENEGKNHTFEIPQYK